MTDPIPLDEASLPAYLRRLGLLAPGESVRIEPAGDGNINWVRRARTADRSFVVKQARPALERFPRYRAPTARIGFEARWLETVARLDEAGVCPRVERFDPAARVLVLEDLGDAPRLDAVLAAGPAPRRPAPDAVAAAIRLARFLGRVHAATSARPELPARFRNDGMQRLHGEHVFALPFRPNDFPLAPPVRERAEQIQREGRVAAVAERAFRRFLEPRGALLHGDVQPANVLLPPRGAVLLDAEIAHVGDPAFDIGTLLAHLWLPAAADGAPEGAAGAVDATWAAWRDAGGAGLATRADADRYAGLEILRRTIGAARAPVVELPEAALPAIAFALQLL